MFTQDILEAYFQIFLVFSVPFLGPFIGWHLFQRFIVSPARGLSGDQRIDYDD